MKDEEIGCLGQIDWLAVPPEFQKLAARSVFGCKPHCQTTKLCAALFMASFMVALIIYLQIAPWLIILPTGP